MRVLVVGAGAVGQVYGRHLALGGAEVTFLVKDKYAAACRAGFTMYPLNGGGRVRFDGAGVITGADEAARTSWDQVFLTVSSTAVRGDWLGPLVAAVGDATVVSLQPGLDNRAHVLSQGVAAANLVSGMIGFISYPAPLPGETRFAEPGMAYWFPFASPSVFSGPRARPVVEALRRGRAPARLHADVGRLVGFPSAIMMTYLVALEAAGWSIAELRRGRLLEVGGHAAVEAMAVVARELDTRPPLVRLLARPSLMRLLLAVAPRLAPLPLETYLQFHFTKVADQTRLFIEGYLDKAAQYGLPATSLQSLVRALPPA